MSCKSFCVYFNTVGYSWPFFFSIRPLRSYCVNYFQPIPPGLTFSISVLTWFFHLFCKDVPRVSSPLACYFGSSVVSTLLPFSVYDWIRLFLILLLYPASMYSFLGWSFFQILHSCISILTKPEYSLWYFLFKNKKPIFYSTNKILFFVFLFCDF